MASLSWVTEVPSFSKNCWNWQKPKGGKEWEKSSNACKLGPSWIFDADQSWLESYFVHLRTCFKFCLAWEREWSGSFLAVLTGKWRVQIQQSHSPFLWRNSRPVPTIISHFMTEANLFWEFCRDFMLIQAYILLYNTESWSLSWWLAVCESLDSHNSADIFSLFVQVDSVLGPLQLSLYRMLNDVFHFLLLFLVLYLSFTTGLAKIYRYYVASQLEMKTRNNTHYEETHPYTRWEYSLDRKHFTIDRHH